jgi:hypothetical protein
MFGDMFEEHDWINGLAPNAAPRSGVLRTTDPTLMSN